MSLKKKAESNTSVVKRNSDKSEDVLKNGIHVDNKQKMGNPTMQNETVIGLSVGSTLNMDNYESLRVDCWISDTVKDGETVEQAYNRLREVLSAQFVETVNEYRE